MTICHGFIFPLSKLKVISKEYSEEKKGEVIVDAPEDTNIPLYRNGAGYKTELKDRKIKVHYYYTDC